MTNQIAARRFQRKNTKRFIITISTGAISLCMGYFLWKFLTGFIEFLVAGFILASALFYISNIYLCKANIWRLGAEGEEKIARELNKLRNYRVFHDISLYDNFGIKSNIDHIVIGKNGVFMIETKNHKGTISCNRDEWKQEKVGRLGTPYLGEIKNPSKQVKRNTILLKGFIENTTRKKVKYWINCVLVFTNEEAVLNISNPTVPVLRAEELNDFILNFRPQRNFTQEETEELGGIISKM